MLPMSPSIGDPGTCALLDGLPVRGWHWSWAECKGTRQPIAAREGSAGRLLPGAGSCQAGVPESNGEAGAFVGQLVAHPNCPPAVFPAEDERANPGVWNSIPLC